MEQSIIRIDRADVIRKVHQCVAAVCGLPVKDVKRTDLIAELAPEPGVLARLVEALLEEFLIEISIDDTESLWAQVVDVNDLYNCVIRTLIGGPMSIEDISAKVNTALATALKLTAEELQRDMERGPIELGEWDAVYLGQAMDEVFGFAVDDFVSSSWRNIQDVYDCMAGILNGSSQPLIAPDQRRYDIVRERVGPLVAAGLVLGWAPVSESVVRVFLPPENSRERLLTELVIEDMDVVLVALPEAPWGSGPYVRGSGRPDEDEVWTPAGWQQLDRQLLSGFTGCLTIHPKDWE